MFMCPFLFLVKAGIQGKIKTLAPFLAKGIFHGRGGLDGRKRSRFKNGHAGVSKRERFKNTSVSKLLLDLF